LTRHGEPIDRHFDRYASQTGQKEKQTFNEKIAVE